MKTIKPNSTCLSEIAYDAPRKALFLTFSHGGRYRYDDVDEDTFCGLVAAPSIGRAFHELIRGKFDFARA